jgi:hypothetical protein
MKELAMAAIAFARSKGARARCLCDWGDSFVGIASVFRQNAANNVGSLRPRQSPGRSALEKRVGEHHGRCEWRVAFMSIEVEVVHPSTIVSTGRPRLTELLTVEIS